MNRVFIWLAASLFSVSAAAQQAVSDRNIDTIEVFPVSQLLENSDNEPVTVIDTGYIANDLGEEARGPHDIVFSLDSDAEFAVILNGQTIAPGGTYTLTVNLTDLGHRLMLPVYPAEDLQIGTAPYTLALPNLNVEVCPATFTERANDCYKIEFATLTYMCPADHTYRANTADCRYVDVVPLTLNCPDDYSQVGDTCSRTLTQAVEYQCPAGTSLQAGACISDDAIASTSCPSGHTLNSSGQCSQVTNSYAAESPCPLNYTNSNGQCTRVVSRAPASDLTCDDGYLLENGTCYREDQSQLWLDDERYARTDPQNSALFTLNSVYYIPRPSNGCEGDYPLTGPYDAETGIQCFADAAPEMELTKFADTCQSGYQFVTNAGQLTCIDENDTQQPYKTCDAGYTFDPQSNSCERTYTKPFGQYCGDILTSEATCFEYSYAPAGNYCELGYVYDDQTKSCLDTATTAATPTCESGFQLNAAKTSCQRNESIDLNISCAAGYTRSADGSYCYQTATQPAAQSCPTGAAWTKDGTTCRYFDSLDVAACPAGTVRLNGSCHDLRVKWQSCPAGYANNGSGTCLKNEAQAAAQSCPSGWSKSGTSCSIFETADVQSCPAGTVKLNGSCHDVRAKWQGCPAGYTNNGSGTCVKSETQAATQSCPSGWTKDGTTCRSFSSQNVSSCPAGYTLRSGSCHDVAAKNYSCPAGYVRSGTTCTKTISVAPEPGECPATNFKAMYGTGEFTSEKDGLCFYYEAEWRETWSIVKPSGSCPSGTTLNSSTGMCESSQTTSASASCPSNYSSLNTSSCYANSATYSVGSCASGYSLNTSNGNCERTQTQTVTYSCPATGGWSLSGTSCNRTLTQSASSYCASGWTSYSASQCYETAADLAKGSCASGYALNSTTGNCERTRTQSVTYSCPSTGGWSLSGSSCNRTLSEAVNYYCASGWTNYNSTQCYETQADFTKGSCQAGYTLNTANGNCEDIDSREVTYTCPTGAGWSFDKPNCNYYVEDTPIVSCPANYAMNSAQNACTRTSIHDVSFSCPDSFRPDPNNNRCYRETIVPKL